MDNFVDVVRLVYLLKVPTPALLEPKTVWILLGIGYLVAVLATMGYMIARGQGIIALIVLALAVFAAVVGAGNLSSLIFMWILLIPIIVFVEGFSFFSGLVRVGQINPLLIIWAGIGVTVIILVLYIADSRIATLVYLAIVVSISSMDLYSNANQGAKRDAPLGTLVIISFFALIIIAVSGMNTSEFSDGEKLAHSIGRWLIGGCFSSGCIVGGWYRLSRS